MKMIKRALGVALCLTLVIAQAEQVKQAEQDDIYPHLLLLKTFGGGKYIPPKETENECHIIQVLERPKLELGNEDMQKDLDFKDRQIKFLQLRIEGLERELKSKKLCDCQQSQALSAEMQN
jgi:hypothetical protein